MRTRTAREMMTHNTVRLTFEEQLGNIVDEVIAPTIKLRKIQMQKAGGFYKARFDGEATCCFGDTPQQATKRVKFFASESER
jgi:hypothetical protein